MKTMKWLAVALVAIVVAGCQEQKRPVAEPTTDNTTDLDSNAGDSTIYGKCGEGTMMSTLELVDELGKTRTFLINQDDSSTVQGGLMTGDALAVIASVKDGDTLATKVINLTTLQGKWVSIAKSFEIQDGGVVASNQEAEQSPWTTWKIYNGHLVLNTDTFDINVLGADSLFLENADGIFGYKRIK